MDKVVDSGSTDAGSIPVRDARKYVKPKKLGVFFIAINLYYPNVCLHR